MEKEKNNNSNYNSYLEFEGEFLNGKKHGNAKEYNEEKILIFEGKYLYILRLGISIMSFRGYSNVPYNNYRIKGKEYNNKGKLKYEGEYL